MNEDHLLSRMRLFYCSRVSINIYVLLKVFVLGAFVFFKEWVRRQNICNLNVFIRTKKRRGGGVGGGEGGRAIPSNAEEVDSSGSSQISPGRLHHSRMGEPRHVVTSRSGEGHVLFFHTIFIKSDFDLLWWTRTCENENSRFLSIPIHKENVL